MVIPRHTDYIHPLQSRPLPTFCQSLASSTGLLLKTAGLKVTAIKIDPYMNIDAGTMAPTEHGQWLRSQRSRSSLNGRVHRTSAVADQR